MVLHPLMDSLPYLIFNGYVRYITSSMYDIVP